MQWWSRACGTKVATWKLERVRIPDYQPIDTGHKADNLTETVARGYEKQRMHLAGLISKLIQAAPHEASLAVH